MSDKLDFQVFFEEKDAKKLSVGVLALSVTFGASSPKGGASGVPVRPTRDEQSLIFSETVVPCYRDSQQLDKVRLSRSRCPL